MKTVWDFLGIEPKRKPEKTVQLVKHFSEVNKRADEGIFHKKVEFPMYVQVKKDGVFCFVVVDEDGDAMLFNRTGKVLQNVQHLADHYSCRLHHGVYLTELTNSEWSLEVLSGVVNPNRVEPLSCVIQDECKYMKLNFHDYLTIGEFIEGESTTTYLGRYTKLFIYGVDGEEILPIAEVGSLEALYKLASVAIATGEEGVVAKQDVGWKAGAKDWHQMKLVRSISYDLECIGWEEGTGKYKGKVANLFFRWKDGKTVKAMLGKGWTHEDAESMFKLASAVEHGVVVEDYYNYPVGNIYKVYALQESSKGVLRLPKVGEVRTDKETADY